MSYYSAIMHKKGLSIAILFAALFAPSVISAQQATTMPVTIRVSDPTRRFIIVDAHHMTRVFIA